MGRLQQNFQPKWIFLIIFLLSAIFFLHFIKNNSNKTAPKRHSNPQFIQILPRKFTTFASLIKQKRMQLRLKLKIETHRINKIPRRIQSDTVATFQRRLRMKYQLQNESYDRLPINHTRFYVFDAKCTMPAPNPFALESLPYQHAPPLPVCSTEPDLISVRYNGTLQQYQLHVNEGVPAKLTTFKEDDNFGCFYREIARGRGAKADHRTSYGPKVYFAQDTLVPQTVEAVLVECHLFNRNVTLQRDAFTFIQEHVEMKREKPKFRKNSLETESPRKPNFIAIGLDSLSRINLRRSMPQMRDFLNGSGWFELQGYNKIADNTFPNLFGIFTGYTPNEANTICNINAPGCFDRFPFVWKSFQRWGYLTAYAEDISRIHTFNLGKGGFRHTPVDYYLRPFTIAIERLLPLQHRFGYHFCIGRRRTISYIFGYCRQLLERFARNVTQPIFGTFWSSSITHDNYYGGGTLDAKLREYMREYESLGLFETSIVMFFSDHGARYGSLRNLPDGFYEERMPIVFIWLPQWFRDLYPEHAEALRFNRNRLTSNFDLYMTMTHIIELGEQGLKLRRSKSCPTCQSVLRRIPIERTCEQAGIPLHWCMCEPYEQLTTDPYVKVVAKAVVQKLNAHLAIHHLSTLCQPLVLGKVLLGEQKFSYNDQGHRLNSSSLIIYRVKFETLPGNARYQSTVTVNRENHRLENFSVNDVSRLNAYRSDAHCVHSKIVKKFCMCSQKIIRTDIDYNDVEKDE